MRPSKRRFMPNNIKPQAELLLLGLDFLADEEGW